MNTHRPVISLILVNGLANRLRALRTAFDMVDELGSYQLRFAWPLEPGICDIPARDVFNPSFLADFQFIPSSTEETWLKSSLRTGLHRYPSLGAWGLYAGWLREKFFWPKVKRNVLRFGEPLFIVTGGLLGSEGDRFTETRAEASSLLELHPWSSELEAEIDAARRSDSEVGIHLRLSNHRGLFPSPPRLRGIVLREMGPGDGRIISVATDSPPLSQRYIRAIEGLGFKPKVVASGLSHLRPELRDFVRLSQSTVVFAPFWSTFAKEGLSLLGKPNSRLVPLRRPLPASINAVLTLLRRLRGILALGEKVAETPRIF